MVFVTPQKDMIVKQSRNVDANGKWLTQIWHAKTVDN